MAMTGRELMQALLSNEVDLDTDVVIDVAAATEKDDVSQEEIENILDKPIRLEAIHVHGGEIVLQPKIAEVV